MDKEKMEFFKRRLVQEKKDIIKSLNDMDKVEFGSMEMDHIEAAGYDNHPADVGTEVYMLEQNKGLKDKLENTVYEVEESLKDINDGIYGICSNCKKEIDTERLKLIPYLKLCVKCAQTISPAVGYRQMDADSSEANFFGVSKRDSIGIDGEDVYQRVADVNIVEGDPSMSTGDNMGLMDEEDGVEDVENISQEYYDNTLR